METKTIKLDKDQYGVFIKLLKHFISTYPKPMENSPESCSILVLRHLLTKCAKRLFDERSDYKVTFQAYEVAATNWALASYDIVNFDPYTWTVYSHLYQSLETNTTKLLCQEQDEAN
jgi:hypothetical protein